MQKRRHTSSSWRRLRYGTRSFGPSECLLQMGCTGSYRNPQGSGYHSWQWLWCWPQAEVLWPKIWDSTYFILIILCLKFIVITKWVWIIVDGWNKAEGSVFCKVNIYIYVTYIIFSACQIKMQGTLYLAYLTYIHHDFLAVTGFSFIWCGIWLLLGSFL